ncbi:Fur family iron response transcriptional regulator [Rhodoblastus acidophilus]|uniref:iron response transcriptional regulator IrrA n=1 Tax=Rhodoblastus acidophilus TaxID=1074 RepID=UPI0018402D9F|nr:Fur family transcriptional regulator [Rhodoblastus acidophilus]MCW2286422.1 Fur family iron response transcriptional regulator [Rhodoblastus acidophilus]MCW2335271.1 Fur family iron response transcriptional regulator [Rhodoblastus acidophilus]
METFGGEKSRARIAYDWRGGPLARMIRQRLQAARLRPSRQRVSLAGLLFVAGDRHVTAEQLYREAQALEMPLSLATVYNTLRQFVAAGLIREIAVFGSKVWYDTNVGSHSHYFDENRQRLSDIPEDLTKNLKIAPPPGYRVVGVDVIVRLCDDDALQ